MNWFFKVIKQYADFSGRARRKEYWMFALFSFIFYIIAAIIDNVLGTDIDGVGYGLFYILFALGIFIPSLAVGVRRLHDVGKSGWMLLIGLIPLIGWIWIFILTVSDSDQGDNKYGQNPKTVILD